MGGTSISIFAQSADADVMAVDTNNVYWLNTSSGTVSQSPLLSPGLVPQ